MRKLNRARAAGLGAVLALLVAVTAHAQINGTPPSVTSIGFGGHFDRPQGVPPSVTSLGPQGFTPNHQFFNPTNCCLKGAIAPEPNPLRFGHHPHQNPVFPFGAAVYPMPYPVYILTPPEEAPAPAMDQQDYPAGPTIFDRRASGQSSQAVEAGYAVRVHDERETERAPAPQPAAVHSPAAVAEPAPISDQPATVLVFKDGHRLEVKNYAIVGIMLYDLSSGHRSKIAISDLDLDATARQNDERGIDFQLPAKPETN